MLRTLLACLVFAGVLCGQGTVTTYPTPTAGGGASPAGSNGDVQVKNGAALAAAGMNCVGGNCSIGTTVIGAGQGRNVQADGAICDGTTDDTTAILLAISTVNTAGGGTVLFPAGKTCRANGQILFPNDGVTPQPSQKNIDLACGGGGGGAWYGTNACVLDVRYTGSAPNGKIETRGMGTLKISGMTIKDGGASNTTALFHSTNTTPIIRDSTFIGSGNVGQKGIVLGAATETICGTVTCAFQGYRPRIESSHFRNLGRPIYALVFANDLTLVNSSFQANTGTSLVEADASASSHTDKGWYVAGNTFEVDAQVNAVFTNMLSESAFVGNNCWDAGGSFTGCYNVTGLSTRNTFVVALQNSNQPSVIGDAASLLNSTVIGEGNSRLPPCTVLNGVPYIDTNGNITCDVTVLSFAPGVGGGGIMWIGTNGTGLRLSPDIIYNASQDLVIGTALLGLKAYLRGSPVIIGGNLDSTGTSPTIASGFGSSPSLETGSTNISGRITVGTGGSATTGVITFDGATGSYALAPSCYCNNESTTLLCKATATTTTLTLSSSTAWTAADKLTWVCVGH